MSVRPEDVLIDPPALEREKVYGALCVAFGGQVYDWPDPRRSFSAMFRGHRALAKLHRCGLGDFVQHVLIVGRYEREMDKGQGHDDAGGYLWRAWQAALGWRVPGEGLS